MKPKYEIVSAAPGEPSILWIGKSGNKYRRMVDAKKDKSENAFVVVAGANGNVSDSESGNNLIFIVVAVILLILIVYKIIK